MLGGNSGHPRAAHWRRILRAAGRRLRAGLRSSERLIVLLKELDSIAAPGRSAGLRVEDMSSEHLPALSLLNRRRGRPWADRRFARYLGEGVHGFVGFLGEELVGYYWWVDARGQATFPDLRKLGLGIELGEGEVYGSDFFVLQEHRGGGLAAEFLFQLEGALASRGYTRLWGYVVSGNRPARWTYSIRGYRPMWIVERRKVLFIERTKRESVTEVHER